MKNAKALRGLMDRSDIPADAKRVLQLAVEQMDEDAAQQAEFARTLAICGDGATLMAVLLEEGPVFLMGVKSPEGRIKSPAISGKDTVKLMGELNKSMRIRAQQGRDYSAALHMLCDA